MTIMCLSALMLAGSLAVVFSVVADADTMNRQDPPASNWQDPNQLEEQKERVFEDSIPKHVPLRIKIKRDRLSSFRDLKNKNWAKEFELEVTNSGEKPIYEFYLLLVTDVRAQAGFRIVAPLTYGRPELAELGARPTEGDIPLQPGETCVLTIHWGQLAAWDIVWERENRPYPNKVQIKLQGVSFGDGTAYMGNEGVLLPRKIK